MENLLQTSSIKVLENYDIVEWSLNQENNVTKINVASDLVVLELICTLFLCFERKIVMRRTIRGTIFSTKLDIQLKYYNIMKLKLSTVINEAGLVFDGRLVINEKCQTSDPNIFAAGPMTKYKRILYADDERHQYFSSIEVGALLAHQLFEYLNPVRPHSAEVKSHLVPGTVHIYKNPLIHYRLTLDGYRFLCIRKPGKQIPYDLMKSSEKYVSTTLQQ